MYISTGIEGVTHSALVPSLRRQAKTLAERGYNPFEARSLANISSEAARISSLERNMDTMVNHVFEDSVVSFTNYYHLNRNREVVSYPEGTILNVDSDERGGYGKFGIESAVAGALDNPGQVVLLYSPPGPVVFDDNPDNKFREEKPYPDGQLYIMYSDGEKVNNVAISISNEGEPWIAKLIPHEYQKAHSKKSDVEKIKYFLTFPVLIGQSIDAFLETQGNLPDKIIFKNKDGIEFSLSQTLALIRQSLADQLPKLPIVNQILSEYFSERKLITADHIDHIYHALAQGYMREKGIETLILGGSCGGAIIKLNPFSHGLDNLSTAFRMITQGENDTQAITFEYKPNHTCQKCHADGETNMLGDCNVCKNCQAKFDSGEFK